MNTRFRRYLGAGDLVSGPRIPCRYRVGVLAAAMLMLTNAALASVVHYVAQKHRAFSVAEITIARGDKVIFTNEDEFLHQIYVDSPAMVFDSSEQPPGRTIEITFPLRGTFSVRCHIHPKMLLIVRVE